MEKKPIDYPLLIVTLLLIAIGITMVYSSSAILSLEKYHDSYYFLKRECLFALMGIILLLIVKSINYQIYYKLTYPIMFVTLGLLALVFVPGLGHRAGGAQRWVNLAGFTFQPSELVKLTTIIFMAYALTKKKDKIKSFTVGFLPSVTIVGILMGAILLQKDLGTTLVIAVVTIVMLFIGGTRLSFLLGSFIALIPPLYFLVFSVDYRRKRITAFLDPWEYQLSSGFQVIQSYVAFNSGGLFGKGLGQGKQKLFYLPAAHTDFIFSVLGEELGLIGVVFVIGLFFLLMLRGFRLATKAPDLFGSYLAFGITSLITIQALINFGVVMGLLPTKGLPLPFISYGGTSLLIFSIMIGILLNISSQIRAR